MKRGRKKGREEKGERERRRRENDGNVEDTVLNCTTSIADFVRLLNIFIYALEKAVQADGYSSSSSLQNANIIECK